MDQSGSPKIPSLSSEMHRTPSEGIRKASGSLRSMKLPEIKKPSPDVDNETATVNVKNSGATAYEGEPSGVLKPETVDAEDNPSEATVPDPETVDAENNPSEATVPDPETVDAENNPSEATIPNVVKDGCAWKDAGLDADFAAHLRKVLKWEKATALQRITLMHYQKNGMTDMRIISPFSSGKTGGYGIPLILEVKAELGNVDHHPGIIGIVVCPSRPLAQDTAQILSEIAKPFRVKVALCCDVVTNTMGSNLVEIDGGRGHIIVTTLGRLKNIASEATTRLGFTPRERDDPRLAQEIGSEYARRFPSLSPFATVKVVVFDQASDMLSGDYQEEIDRFEKTIIPKLAGGFSIVFASADLGEETNAASYMAKWLAHEKKCNRPSLLLEANTTKLFSNISVDIDIIRIGDGTEGCGFLHPIHQSLAAIEIKGRTLIITGSRHMTGLVTEWVTKMDNGRHAGKVGSCHGGLNREAIPRMQNAFLNGDLEVMCATSGMVRGRNLKVQHLYVMFFAPHDKGSRGIMNVLDDIARTGRMGKSGRVKLIFGPDDEEIARGLRDEFLARQEGRPIDAKWDELVASYEAKNGNDSEDVGGNNPE